MNIERERAGVLSGIVGIVCNSGLAVMKIIVGLSVSSMAVLGDGLNNLSDAISSMITLVGAKVSGKGADEDHPFGHARMEYIASAIVAALIIDVGFTLMKDSIKRIVHPEPLQLFPLALVLITLSIAVKAGLFIFNRRLGKKTGSELLMATAMDSLFDVITTALTVVTTFVYAVTEINLDAYAGIVVSVAIILEGVDIFKRMMTPLIGGKMDPELVKSLTELVNSEEGVIGSHDLVIHNYGPGQNMATVHLELDKDLNLTDAHKIADRVERDVFESLNVQLVTHVDPSDINDQRARRVKERVIKIIEALDPNLSIHDFQMMEKGSRYFVSFDLLVPMSYSKGITIEREKQVKELLKAMNSRYEFEITTDHGIREEH